MNKYLASLLMMSAGVFMSCTRDGFGPGGPGGWGAMMHYGYGYGYGGMFMGLLFLIILAVLVYFIVQVLAMKGRPSLQNESPLDILKRRYAKGEITKEQYEQMKKDIEG